MSGEEMEENSLSAIYVNQPTHQVLNGYIGELSSLVIVTSENEIFESVRKDLNSIGIIDFEDLEPKWKVLEIDDVSPLEKNLSSKNYSLNIPISIKCLEINNDELNLMEDIDYVPNRDEERL